MSYQTGSATDLQDLLSKINTFLTGTPGWTSDELDNANGKWAIHKGNVYMSCRWFVSDPIHLSVHQALGFTASNEPGDHPDDSGHGFNTSSSHANSSLLTERCVSYLGDGPFTSYHIFEDDDYFYVAVQSEAGVYKHFGAGELNPKRGDWTGGEFVFGHFLDNGTNQSPTLTDLSILLDAANTRALNSDGRRNATIHVEGLVGMGGSDKWAPVQGSKTNTLYQDTAGNDHTRCLGGFRAGPIAKHWGHFQGQNSAGFVALYPVGCWHYEDATDRVRLLGYMPDVFGVHMKNFAPEDEIVIGSDTYVLFPSSRKTSDNVAFRTYNQGIAYKKVTT